MKLIEDSQLGIDKSHVSLDPFWEQFQVEHEEIFRCRWGLCDQVFSGIETNLHTPIRRGIILSIVEVMHEI